MKALNALIRCDASVQIGLGHITRCLVLANQLREAGHRVYFALKSYSLGIEKVTEQDFEYITPSDPFDYHQWITEAASTLNINLFIGDVRDGLSITTIEALKVQQILTVCIDEPSDYRRACDLCFYPPHAQLEKLDWSGFTGEIKQGLEYLLLRPEFYQHYQVVENPTPKVAVIMGGTDAHSLTLPVITKLLSLQQNIKLEVICKPSHPDYLLLQNQPVQVHEQITNMADFLNSVDMAVVNFGTIIYELITMNTPALVICVHQDHKQQNQYFKAKQLIHTIEKEDFFNPNYQPNLMAKHKKSRNKVCLSKVASTLLERFMHDF